MNNIIYLFLLITNFGFGQSGLVKIEIKDSVRMKPINFEYNVQISESAFNRYDENGAIGKDSAKIKMREKYKELELFRERLTQ